MGPEDIDALRFLWRVWLTIALRISPADLTPPWPAGTTVRCPKVDPHDSQRLSNVHFLRIAENLTAANTASKTSVWDGTAKVPTSARRLHSRERATPVNPQHLSGTVGLPHQIEICLRDLLDFADMSYGKFLRSLPVERLTVNCHPAWRRMSSMAQRGQQLEFCADGKS
jgi:hypothetical protein